MKNKISDFTIKNNNTRHPIFSLTFKRLLAFSLLLILAHAPVQAQWNLAVLPHENVVGDPQWNWLSLAISEGYVNAYYHVPKMYAVDEEHVRGKLGGTRISTSDMAKKLNIHLVLMGRYQIIGTRIHIETDVLQAATGETIETFVGDASISAPLDAILPILYAIADQFKVTLKPEEKTSMQVPMFHNAEALHIATESQMALYQALRQSPLDPSLLLQAQSGFKRAANRDAKSAMPHYYLGRLYETQKKTSDAEMAYREALKINFEHVAARYHLALLLKNQNRKDDAMNELEQALRQSPIDADIQAALSGMFFNQYTQTFETITSQLRETIKATPNDPSAYYELANAYNELDRIDEAIQYYTQALERDPNWADAHFKLGLIAHRQGHHEKAIEHLQKAAANNTQFVRVHFWLGSISYLLKQYEPAVEAFANAVKAESNYVIPQYHLGLSYQATGQNDKALEAFKKYADLTTDDYRPYYQMAEIIRQKGDLNGAIQGYGHAVALNPIHVQSHLRLGYIHAEQNKLGIAIQQLQTVLRLQPDHPDAAQILSDIQKWEQQ